MDDGKFWADFVAANAEKIFNIGKMTYGKLSDAMKLELKTAYVNYLENVYKKYSKSKSFFIRSQSVDFYDYYVPIGLAGDNFKIEIPDFGSCLKKSERMVLLGTGGCGKTVLMKHLFLSCILQNRYAPVLVELRDFNESESSLDKMILSNLDSFGFKADEEFVKKAKEMGHFAFFLDGFDEVDYKKRSRLNKEIKKLANKYSGCPVFISSRPDDVFLSNEDFNCCSVLSLDLSSASELIEKLPYDEDVKSKFVSDLSSGLFERHSSFLSNPLLLSIMLLTYGENAQIPSKLSIFYNQAYEALFQRHDAHKSGYRRNKLTNLDILDFSRVFGLFALQTYDKRLFRMPRTLCLSFIEKARGRLGKSFKPEDYLLDLLSAACLLIEDGLEVAFSHRSFQEYFVALHISTEDPEAQKMLINKYWLNIDADNVIQLLQEMNPDLVERALIIPRLKFLFDEVGVKRSVGITHAAAITKKFYGEIRISRKSISAAFNRNESQISTVLDMAVNLCGTFNRPEKEYFSNFVSDMQGKYLDKGEEFKMYDTKSLTYRTPVMKDLLSSGGHFSIEYFQAGWEAYKILKKKHESNVQELNALLNM